jgi:Pyridoxamine 5'-phosphate oxidase
MAVVSRLRLWRGHDTVTTLGCVDAGVADRVKELFGGGAAVVAATANAEGRPSITRGWGATISAEGYVVVCLTAHAGSAMRSNLAANGRIAVTVADVGTYNSAQVKGTVDLVRDPTDAELDLAKAHQARFADAAHKAGAADAGCLMIGNLVAVGFMADEVYDQTPGGRAGQALT